MDVCTLVENNQENLEKKRKALTMRKTGLTLPFIHTHSSCLLSLALTPGVWQCFLAEGLLPPTPTPTTQTPPISLSLSASLLLVCYVNRALSLC